MASPDKKRKIAPKVFNDPIHGNIELHPLLVKIVDTPQFQRLRFINQLGGVYFVYPGASHNRFEHSIGVCHLAGRFVRALRDNQPELKIEPEDELCVEIAALCHDLGHGPFSHLFDRKIIPEAWGKRKISGKWTHEQGSIDMLEHMLKENDGLAKEFDTKLTETDKTFIKELINGPKKDDRKGRKEEKWFLYEIVSNKRNEIDVDKWDYFARDCHMLGIGNNFNHDRLISFSRVINVKGKDGKLERQICYRDKEATNLYDMFHIRNLLHQRAYQHKTSNSVEIMLAEALVLADEFIKFEGENRIPVRMSDTVNDMKAFTLLNDGVIHKIIESDREELEKSKEILNWILERKLYRCVGEKRFAGGTFEKGEDVIKDIKHTLTDKRLKEILCKLDWKDFIVVEVVPLNYGNKDKDPIANVNFYTKNEPDSAKPRDKDDVSLLLPNVFEEQSVRVYYKNQTDPKNQTDLENQTDSKNQISLQDCKDMFEEWVKSTLKNPRNQVTSGSSQDPRNQGTSGSSQKN